MNGNIVYFEHEVMTLECAFSQYEILTSIHITDYSLKNR